MSTRFKFNGTTSGYFCTAAVLNGRGNGALLKVGAVQEGLLRKSFQRDGRYLDQVLYSIVEDDWRASRDVAWPTHHMLVH